MNRMFDLKSKTTALVAGGALLLGVPGYGYLSMRSEFNDRVTTLENELNAVKSQSTAQVKEVSTDLNYIASKLEITTKELTQARSLAENLKKEHASATQRLRNELASSSKAMSQFREESSSRLEEVKQDTSNKFGVVTGEVQGVRTDLDATKSDLAASRREMGDMRDALGRQIATNSSELAELRRRGERNYIEFDVVKSKTMHRVADVQLQLKKADTKRQKYDVLMLVDDSKVERKDRVVNEPVTFLVGRDRVRYEMIVNYVDKDRIRGYISTPKDKAVATEGPSFKSQN
jgi:uncharacterized phage infection (PIP) family protein YhgE